jgi:hypothetical protein
VGGTSDDTIIPIIPPEFSDTYTLFISDLQAANGGTQVTFGGCTRSSLDLS